MRKELRTVGFLTSLKWVLLGLGIGLPFWALAGDLPSDAEIKTMLWECVGRDHWGVGMVVGVLDERGTRIVSYGKLDNGDSAEVNGDTLFEIGSITKTFTALLLRQMVDRGEMNLNDPVEKFLPASVQMPSWHGRKITLLDLATHRSALPRDPDDWSEKGVYKFLSHCRLHRAPGAKAEYSNLGFMLLGRAIELKAGTNYETLIKERICQPLGMTSTCIVPTPEVRPRWAIPHGSENRATGDIGSGDFPGAGCIRSTANDLLKYAAANMGLSNSALTPLMEKNQQAQVHRGFGAADVALPWWVYHKNGSELITHGGATGGHNAFLGFDKGLKRAVVVLANRSDENGQAVQPLGMHLLHPYADKPGRTRIAAEILDSYAGLYLCRKAPSITLAIQRHGDDLMLRLVGSAAGVWLPQSQTEFAFEWGGSHLRMWRGLGGKMKTTFVNDEDKTDKTLLSFSRVSEHVPDSLFEPMAQPLATNDCRPRKDSDLQGTWQATSRSWLRLFTQRHATVRMAELTPGVFQGEFDIDDAKQVPIAVIYDRPAVELVDRVGEGLFIGKINSDHTRIKGHVRQGGISVPVVIERAK